MEDIQFLNVLKGKRIKLTLKTSSYLGVVQRINPNKTLILADVVSGSNGCKFPGSKLFFGHEILNVEFPSEADTDRGDVPGHRLDGEHLDVNKFQPYRMTLSLDGDEEEEERINFVVIDEFHERFGPAVMHIKEQHVIGVGADGIEVFQHGRLCWLQIATKKKVYLFDILLLGTRAFKNGLSMILENKHILKVIHDCRAIAGCLVSQFGVKLTNVFDTQVADVMCFYSETGGLLPDRVSTLQEVVSLHLKVPSSQLLSLQMKSQLTKEEREMWQTRPCPLPLLKVMALSVIHLQPLRLVLLDAFMTDYMAMVDSYLDSSYYEPGELEHVSMASALELPRELRQLGQMRRERREWAAHRYPVTEQGLLARFNPRAQPPPETLPPAQEQSQVQEDSFEPESSTQVEVSLLHKPPTSPVRGDATALPKEMPVNSPLPVGVGRGYTDVLMDTAGRGRPPAAEQSSVPILPTIGRGFLLQISQAQLSKDGTGYTETPGRVGTAPLCPTHTLQPDTSCNDLSNNTSGVRGHHPEVLPLSLRQSFRCFRY